MSVVFFSFTSCGSSDGGEESENSNTTESTGFIIHVEDGIILNSTVTDSNGNQATEVGDGDYEFSVEPTGTISATGGIDVGSDGAIGGDDDIDLTGVTLKAPAGYENISHLTQMVVNYQENNDLTVEEAENSIAEYYGFSKDNFDKKPSEIIDSNAKEISDRFKITEENKNDFDSHLESDFDEIETHSSNITTPTCETGFILDTNTNTCVVDTTGDTTIKTGKIVVDFSQNFSSSSVKSLKNLRLIKYSYTAQGNLIATPEKLSAMFAQAEEEQNKPKVTEISTNKYEIEMPITSNGSVAFTSDDDSQGVVIDDIVVKENETITVEDSQTALKSTKNINLTVNSLEYSSLKIDIISSGISQEINTNSENQISNIINGRHFVTVSNSNGEVLISQFIDTVEQSDFIIELDKNIANSTLTGKTESFATLYLKSSENSFLVAVSDENGNFAFNNLKDGSYTVNIQKTDFKAKNLKDIEVSGSKNLGTISLENANNTGSISGYAYFENQTEHAGMDITVERLDGDLATNQLGTLKDGAFLITDLPEGKYRFLFGKSADSEYSQEDLVVEVAKNTTKIIEKPIILKSLQGNLSATLNLPAGFGDVDNLTIEVIKSDGTILSSQKAENNDFTISNIDNCEGCKLKITGSNYNGTAIQSIETSTFNIESDQTTNIEVPEINLQLSITSGDNKQPDLFDFEILTNEAVATLNYKVQDPEGDQITCKVDWNDGSEVEEIQNCYKTPKTHTYKKAGTYNILFKVADENHVFGKSETIKLAFSSLESNNSTIPKIIILDEKLKFNDYSVTFRPINFETSEVNCSIDLNSESKKSFDFCGVQTIKYSFETIGEKEINIIASDEHNTSSLSYKININQLLKNTVTADTLKIEALSQRIGKVSGSVNIDVTNLESFSIDWGVNNVGKREFNVDNTDINFNNFEQKYEYSKDGNYTVSIIATDKNGNISEKTETIEVRENYAPFIEVNNISIIENNVSFELQVEDIDQDPFIVEINWGNGESINLYSPELDSLKFVSLEFPDTFSEDNGSITVKAIDYNDCDLMFCSDQLNQRSFDFLVDINIKPKIDELYVDSTQSLAELNGIIYDPDSNLMDIQIDWGDGKIDTFKVNQDFRLESYGVNAELIQNLTDFEAENIYLNFNDSTKKLQIENLQHHYETEGEKNIIVKLIDYEGGVTTQKLSVDIYLYLDSFNIDTILNNDYYKVTLYGSINPFQTEVSFAKVDFGTYSQEITNFNNFEIKEFFSSDTGILEFSLELKDQLGNSFKKTYEIKLDTLEPYIDNVDIPKVTNSKIIDVNFTLKDNESGLSGYIISKEYISFYLYDYDEDEADPDNRALNFDEIKQLDGFTEISGFEQNISTTFELENDENKIYIYGIDNGGNIVSFNTTSFYDAQAPTSGYFLQNSFQSLEDNIRDTAIYNDKIYILEYNHELFENELYEFDINKEELKLSDLSEGINDNISDNISDIGIGEQALSIRFKDENAYIFTTRYTTQDFSIEKLFCVKTIENSSDTSSIIKTEQCLSMFPILEENSSFKVERINNKFFIFENHWGDEYHDYNNPLFIFDTETNDFYPEQELPTEITELKTKKLNDKFYILGSNTDELLYIYDSENNSWSSIEIPFIEEDGHSIEVVNDKVYLLFYNSNDGKITLEIYDPSTDSWSSGSNLNSDIYHIGFTTKVVNNKILVFERSESESFETKISFYDTETNSWIFYNSLEETINSQFSHVIDDKVYFIQDNSIDILFTKMLNLTSDNKMRISAIDNHEISSYYFGTKENPEDSDFIYLENPQKWLDQYKNFTDEFTDKYIQDTYYLYVRDELKNESSEILDVDINITENYLAIEENEISKVIEKEHRFEFNLGEQSDFNITLSSEEIGNLEFNLLDENLTILDSNLEKNLNLESGLYFLQVLNNGNLESVDYNLTFDRMELEESWTTGETQNNWDISKKLEIVGATSLEVTVSGETESGYDYFYIYDSQGNEVYSESGTHNQTFTVNGSWIRARINTDDSENESGVTVTIKGYGYNSSVTDW
jgi:hypothetical protein